MSACVCSWNMLDLGIVVVSIVSIIFTEMEMADAIPINPSILRVCRVLRLAQGIHTLNQTKPF